jgi:hypothetical protein
VSIILPNARADSSMTKESGRLILPPTFQIVLATLTGLALRLLFVLRFPLDAGDTGIYEELARNWIDDHVYGLYFPNGLLPSDIRGPGYPAFISLIYLLIRRSRVVILLAQALLDICTCYLVAGLVSLLAPEAVRRRVTLAALWLAATCPFVANYAAVPLTEVLATFLTAAALLALVSGCITLDGGAGEIFGTDARGARGDEPSWKVWFGGGLIVGIGTLVRPETPLVLAAFAAVLAVRWRRRVDWGKLLRAGLFSALGLLLPLLPWAARNWVSLNHEVQFLSPRFAETPDQYAPRGLYAWTATWLERYRDVYLVPWNVDGSPIQISDIPPSAFDSPEERDRTENLLDAYNGSLVMTPEVDNGFAELARERTARHPLRTYLRVPLERAATIWFTPRVELLPLSGHLTPVAEKWREDRVDFSVSAASVVLNFFYVGLALWGLRRALKQDRTARTHTITALSFLVAFILLRTAFLTTVETPEPRYVLECFPALLAIGALAWLPRSKGLQELKPR